jgi:SWI/SNF-related matrix-associated actin-dependent regulator 1 of chromatin subfamily A
MKRDFCFNWIDDVLESGEKLIVFAHHKAVIQDIMDRYKDIAVKIDGSVSEKDRDQAKTEFQTNDKIRLFVGNHKAAGEGITLTAAHLTVFVELSLIPTELQQAGDRNHRIGQTRAVFEYYLIADHTLESEIMEIIDDKRKDADAVLDGIVTSEKELLSELMQHYKLKYKDKI